MSVIIVIIGLQIIRRSSSLGKLCTNINGTYVNELLVTSNSVNCFKPQNVSIITSEI